MSDVTTAVQTIRMEHFNIASVLTCLAHSLREIEAGRWQPDHRLLAAVVEYLERYPEVYHHPKEEDYLFAAMRRRRPELNKKLDMVREEHIKGARMLAELSEAQVAYSADESTFGRFKAVAEEYLYFERRHMQREERELLPLALQILTEEDWREINAAFASNDDPLFGSQRRQEFKDLVDRILELAPSPLGFAAREPELQARA